MMNLKMKTCTPITGFATNKNKTKKIIGLLIHLCQQKYNFIYIQKM